MEASVLSFSLECILFSFQLSHGHFRRLIDGCDRFNHWYLVLSFGNVGIHNPFCPGCKVLGPFDRYAYSPIKFGYPWSNAHSPAIEPPIQLCFLRIIFFPSLESCTLPHLTGPNSLFHSDSAMAVAVAMGVAHLISVMLILR